jgi:hypothetical protein
LLSAEREKVAPTTEISKKKKHGASEKREFLMNIPERGARLESLANH